MSMFTNIFKSRPKPQPQQEFLSHDGMSLFYEQTVSHIKQNVVKIQTHPSSTSSSGKPSKQRDTEIEKLKNICNEVMDHMKQVSNHEVTKEKKAETIEKDMKVKINYYFDPLHHALQMDFVSGASHSHQQQLLVIVHTMQEQVVDCVQKLFLYGYIELGIPYEGTIPIEIGASATTSSNVMLIEAVVKSVCDCFSSTSISKKSSAVQLMIVKAMTTGITSCGMHGKSLRRAITTCLNIYLVNRDSVVLETAKASLSQMFNSVFHRMVDHQGEYDPSSVAGDDDDADDQDMLLQIRQEEQRLVDEKDVSEMTESEKVVHDFITDLFERVAQDVIDSDAQAVDSIENNEDAASATPDSKQTKKQSANQNFNFQNLYEKDAFYLLRQLLQLSLKRKLDASNPATLNALHISLEFILDILRKYSEAILASGNSKNNLFIRDIKYILCLSLIKNSVSGQIALFELSIRILEVLFRQGFVLHLRSELPPIFLSFLNRCISSEHSSAEQKLIVLNTFQNCIAKDGQLLVDLFTNYDCVLGYGNVFGAIIKTVCDLCKNIKSELGWISQSQEQKIRQQSLQVITSILQSLSKFMDERQYIESEQVVFDQRAEKLLLFEAATIFNQKPEKGIAFLIENKKLPDPQDDQQVAAKAIAKLLYDHRNTIINKKKIGEYIGGNKDKVFSHLVRHEYTSQQNFKDMPLVVAMRNFLNTFRLPGEGQVVERCLEAFSQCYFKEVESTAHIYANEDAVYLLAYAVIMLNVEMHNPAFAFRERMAETMFISSLSSTNGTGDFPTDILTGVYHDIKGNEIKMEGDDQIYRDPLSDFPPSSLTLTKKKQIVYDDDTKKAYKREKLTFNRSMIQYTKKCEPQMFNAQSRAHIGEMFKTTWEHFQSVACDLLKRFDDEPTIELCLSIFKSCIHIAARFELDSQRDAFVVSLSEFSKLNKKNVINIVDQFNPTIPPQLILNQKNMDCMRLLLQISEREGDYLRQSWQHILQCISELERLRIFASSEPAQDEKKQHRRSNSTIEPLNVYQHLTAVIKRNMKTSMIDAVFLNSVKLNNDAFSHFSEALCKISDKELSEEESRKYSLGRLVETISVNLTPENHYARIRAVWPPLWKSCLFAHYMKFGTGNSHENSMTVIDSLRQVAAKFLECASLAQDEKFQQTYLRPFHEIIQQSDNNFIRELIIECVGNLTMKFYPYINSGWHLVLHTLSWANRIIPNLAPVVIPRKKYTESAQIIQLGFDFTSSCLLEACLDKICANDSFVACVSCLSAFAKQQLLPQIALRSIELLTETCAKQIVSGRVKPLGPIENEPENVRFSEKIDFHAQIWRPIMLQLSSSASEARIEMRIRSLETLFKMLKETGKLFSSGFWIMIFNDVLFPIFNEITAKPAQDKAPTSPTINNRSSVQFTGAQERTFSDSEWIRTTCHKAMFCLVDLFVEYFDTISFMLKDVMQIICACFKRDRPTDILCQIGNGCIHQLVTNTGSRLSSDHWDLICDYIGQSTIIMDAASNFFQSSSPSPSSSYQDANFLTCITIQCRAQILLLDTCNDILAAHYGNMETRHVQKFLLSLFTSYESARHLNTSQVFCIFLKAHVSVSVPLTEFIIQEVKALTLYFTTLFRMIADQREQYQDRVQLSHTLLLPLLSQILRRFLYQVGVHNLAEDEKESHFGSFINPKETDCLIPVIVLGLEGFANFSQDLFVQYIAEFYPLFCDLIMQTADKNNEIRGVVRKILLRCQPFIPLQ